MIFNFVVLSNYENISTTKISGFTVLRLYCSYWSLKWTDLNGECGLTVRYARLFAIVQAEQDQNKCLLYRIALCPLLRGFVNILKSMEIQSRHLEVSVIYKLDTV